MRYAFKTVEEELSAVKSINEDFFRGLMNGENLKGIVLPGSGSEDVDPKDFADDIFNFIMERESLESSLEYDFWSNCVSTLLLNVYKNTDSNNLNEEEYAAIVGMVEEFYLPNNEGYVVRNAALAYQNGLKEGGEVRNRDWIIKLPSDSLSTIFVGEHNYTSPQTLVRMQEEMIEVSPELDELITEVGEYHVVRTNRKNAGVEGAKAKSKKSIGPKM